MSAGLGPDSTGDWSLTVEVAGQPAKQWRRLPFGHKDFKELHWLGFCSTANHKTAVYLDNIELTNSAGRLPK